MNQRCWNAVARVLFTSAVMATTAGGSVLHAQSTGKIDGHVRTPEGQAIVNATVRITGTAYSAVSNNQGYYFIENIPAGVVSVRASYVGYKPHEIAGVRILTGQTLLEDFTLESSPVVIGELVVTAARNPLVPRDVPSTKQTLTGEMVHSLPVDRLSQAFALQPGVTQLTNCGANLPCNPLISVRGSRVDQNNTYIDGVPVQAGIHTGTATANGGSAVPGAPQLALATNGFEEASITTGASSAAFGNAQGGIINVATKGGGNHLSGNVGVESGLLGLSYFGQGLNIFSGSLGGPIGKKLTFFLSGRVEGTNSNNGGNHGWLFPGFARVSADTAYRVAASGKAGTATAVDSVDVTVYNYADVRGGCDLSANQGGFLGAHNDQMAANYGVSCHANQAYAAPTTNYFTTDKLNYSFGNGSRVSLSYLFSGNQTRGVLADGTTQGTLGGSNVATLNWNQTLVKRADHQLTLDAYISRQWNNTVTSQLTAASEEATRSSPLGFITQRLKFQYNQKDFPVDSTLIYNLLENRTGHRLGITDPKNTGQYGAVPNFNGNLPPDGVGYAAGGGGADNNGLAYTTENRWVGKADLDFQLDRYNRVKFGGEMTKYDITNYSSAPGTNTFIGKPVSSDAYIEDRVDLGDVVLVAGARYDHYWSKAWRWNEFPEISTRPGFSRDSLFCAPSAVPSATAKCALVQDPAHSYVSPHLQVSFPVNDRTNFRLSYAQNVQAPDFGLIYKAALFDLNVSGQNQRGTWGSDLDFGKTITFEFGARHAFSDDMVLDVAVYNNDIVANPSFGFEHPIDPTTGSSQILYLATNKDFGNTRGIDLRLDRRIGNYFNGSLTYSFQDSKNTGTDPFAYLGFFEPAAGFVGDPPTAALTTALSRPHSLTALFNAQLPADFEKGTLIGSLLHRTGFFVTARVASGQAYTRCDPNDAGSIGVVAGNGNVGTCGSLGAVSNFNASRLPMQKQFDLRMTREFRVGKYALTTYLDARNVLNLQNITSIYAQTGTTSSGAASELRYATDSTTFATYAKGTGQYRVSDGAVVLPSTIAGCARVVNGVNSAAPTCYYYIRSEQRFGNGDGVYTLAEQRNASNAKNAFNNSVWARNSGARTVRFGLEVNF